MKVCSGGSLAAEDQGLEGGLQVDILQPAYKTEVNHIMVQSISNSSILEEIV